VTTKPSSSGLIKPTPTKPRDRHPALNTLSSAVNNNAALVQNFQTTQTNVNTSVANQFTQLQTKVDDNLVMLREESSVRAEKDGKLEAQYTVKVDVNGYVSGFGLASTANNSTPYSDFIVRANRFAIGSPSGPGIQPVTPFIVLTTTDAAGNPPGVYMRDTFIQNASIDMAKIKNLLVDNAHIKNLSVDNLKLADGAVSGNKVADLITGSAVVGINGVTVTTNMRRRPLVSANIPGKSVVVPLSVGLNASGYGYIKFGPFVYPEGDSSYLHTGVVEYAYL